MDTVDKLSTYAKKLEMTLRLLEFQRQLIMIYVLQTIHRDMVQLQNM